MYNLRLGGGDPGDNEMDPHSPVADDRLRLLRDSGEQLRLGIEQPAATLSARHRHFRHASRGEYCRRATSL